jgi:ABC-type amino acid transport substrate-binding protein
MRSNIIQLTHNLAFLVALRVIPGFIRQGRKGKVRLSSKFRFRATLFVAFLLTFCSLATAGITTPKTVTRESVRVVMDDNYPPYTFRDSSGKLQGILVDQWALWERKTGTPVQLDAMDWAKAQQRMEAGDYDVIDTLFANEHRKTLYDFSAPYANIDVPLFFSRELSGIRGPKDLEGFVVGAKKGDNSIEILKASGVSTFLLFDNYEAIVTAARDGKIKVFTIDKPPAMYFLIKMGIQDQFRESEPLYSGEFHRAVRKGNTALLEEVQQGFNAISKSDYEDIDRHWYGAPILSKARLTMVAFIAGGAAVIVCLLLLWVGLPNSRPTSPSVKRQRRRCEKVRPRTGLSSTQYRISSSSMTEMAITWPSTRRLLTCSFCLRRPYFSKRSGRCCPMPLRSSSYKLSETLWTQARCRR